MFGVDLLDQRISYDKWVHRFHNWIECWWHHSRSIVLNNCYTIFRQLNGPNTMSAADFKLEIASELMNVREKPRFRGDVSDTCFGMTAVSATRKKCSRCNERPAYKCPKCGEQFCVKSLTSNETCFAPHGMLKVGRKYIICFILISNLFSQLSSTTNTSLTLIDRSLKCHVMSCNIDNLSFMSCIHNYLVSYQYLFRLIPSF